LTRWRNCGIILVEVEMPRKNFDSYVEWPEEELREAGIHRGGLKKAIRLLVELSEALDKNGLELFCNGQSACIWHPSYDIHDTELNVLASVLGPFDGGDI
jgi:hypothetical protein